MQNANYSPEPRLCSFVPAHFQTSLLTARSGWIRYDSDPLRIAVSSGARLGTLEKGGISRQRKLIRKKRGETCAVQSIQMCPRVIELRSSTSV